MQEVHPHESRCLRRPQDSLSFIPSTLSCVLGPARADTMHLTQHSSHRTNPCMFSTPCHVYQQNSIRDIHPEAILCEVLGCAQMFLTNGLICLLDLLIEFSHRLMSKIQPVVVTH